MVSPVANHNNSRVNFSPERSHYIKSLKEISADISHDRGEITGTRISKTVGPKIEASARMKDSNPHMLKKKSLGALK